MTRGTVLGSSLVICAMLGGSSVWRAQHYSVSMEKVADNLYLIAGSGMNATALITDDGVVLVDTMKDGWWGPAALAKLRTVTDKPITTIINTNSHPPHSGNNALFSGTVVDVVAHENTTRRMKVADEFQGESAKFLPGTTFRDRMSLVRGGIKIDLYYFGAANTDGDTWVVFPTLHTMAIGDIVTKGDLPAYERSSGGSGVTQPETLAAALATIKDVDTIIVGHAYEQNDPDPTISWSELQAQQRLSADLLAAVRAAMLNGRSARDVATSVHSTAAFQRYDAKRVHEAVGAIYAELDVEREDATMVPVSVESPAAR